MASPDLAAVRADSLRFWCNLDLTPDQLAQVRKDLGGQVPYDNLPFVFGRRYRRSGSRHSEVGWLRGVESELTLTAEYSVEEAEPVPRGIRSVQWLLAKLATFGLKRSLNCLVSFEYSHDEWRSLIPLPLRLIESEVLPFDELRGVRAVKLREGELAYSLILDQAKNNNHTHLASFAHESIIDGTLPERILEEGARISLLFIKQTEQ